MRIRADAERTPKPLGRQVLTLIPNGERAEGGISVKSATLPKMERSTSDSGLLALYRLTISCK